jgi:hypothetical protein
VSGPHDGFFWKSSWTVELDIWYTRHKSLCITWSTTPEVGLPCIVRQGQGRLQKSRRHCSKTSHSWNHPPQCARMWCRIEQSEPAEVYISDNYNGVITILTWQTM